MKGVTQAKRKNGTVYFRSSITIKDRHISLGSFSDAASAGRAYEEACRIIRDNDYALSDYNEHFTLDFAKFVSLLNLRDRGIYFKTPIYLEPRFFYYYLSPQKRLIFDRDDLFFYANHKIQIRGGYYFICDYGSQYSILSRYGIKSYAKKGVDYVFVNHNEDDFRYENIKVINEYMGVTEKTDGTQLFYEAVIHINGNYLIGRYPDKITAAIAYNKAVHVLQEHGVNKQFIKNYITTMSTEEYHARYDTICISSRIQQFSHLA